MTSGPGPDVAHAFLAGGGEMSALIRSHDWSATALGPIAGWPRDLKTAVGIMLASPSPVSILWGPERVQLYNDAYIPIAAGRHPQALGRTAAQNWSEAYEQFLDPIFERVFAGETVQVDEHAVRLHTPHGGIEERFFTGSFQPVRDETGRVAGVFHPLFEVTARVRADAALREREERLSGVLHGMAEGFGLLAPDFTILEHNPEALRLAGLRREQVIGRSHWEVYPGSRDSELGRMLGRAMTTREPASLEHRYAFEQERALWLDMRAYPAPDGNLAVFWRDVTDRREAEERLRAREADLVEAQRLGRIGSWRFDARTQETTGTAELWRIYGLDPEKDPLPDYREQRGTLYAEETWDRIDAAVAETMRTGRGYELDVEAFVGGRSVWVTTRAEPLRDGSGAIVGLRGTVQDITARKQAEAEHRRQAEELSAIYDAAPVGLCVLDRALRYVRINERLAEINGVPAAEHIGRTVQEVVPDISEQAMAVFRRVLDGAAVTGVEFSGTTPAMPGVVRTWRENWVPLRGAGGEVAGIAVSAEEITEEKAAAEALKASEARLRELNETLEAQVAQRTAERDRVWRLSLDLLSVIDIGSARFDSVNPAWTASLGWSRADIEGRPYADFVHPGDAGASAAAFDRARQGSPVLRFENRCRTRDGRWRWLSWVAVPEGGKLYSVTRDVTEEKQRQAELDVAQEALRQGQKMEAMGQLTGGVAHDFNNLLTPIVGALDMLQRKGLGGAREQRLIAGAMQSAERAKTLVHRLLAFARRQPLQPVAVDIAQLAAGMGELIESTTGPQIKVVVEASGGLPAAKADPNQLEMALLNLAVNARDAMPEGGTLRISATAETVRAGHRAKIRPGDYVRLSVADTGTGMDEATLARAVEPFFSTKGVGKGTGLGLSMVHGLASQLGGALTIQSRPGYGTNVELWLPLSAAPLEAARRADEPSPAPERRGVALLVDDEELVRMSTADMLGDLGYAVVEAGSAEEAVALVERGGRFDLVVTDHLMPGMTGTDLARTLRSSRPMLPVLLVSGYAEHEGIDPDLPRLTKPFRKDELAVSLAQLPTAR